MTRTNRIMLSVALLIVGLMVVGAGLWFAMIQLDAADTWGSVAGGLAAILGLPLTVYGIVLARGGRHGSGQTVTDGFIGGGVTQVRGVRGNVRIGPQGAVATAEPEPAAPKATEPRPEPAAPKQAGIAESGQAVSRTSTTGPVRQVSDVENDLDIDR